MAKHPDIAGSLGTAMFGRWKSLKGPNCPKRKPDRLPKHHFFKGDIYLLVSERVLIQAHTKVLS